MLITKEGMESEVEKIRSIVNFLSTNLSDSPAPHRPSEPDRERILGGADLLPVIVITNTDISRH